MNSQYKTDLLDLKNASDKEYFALNKSSTRSVMNASQMIPPFHWKKPPTS
jgi:hypothetical protein